MTATVSEIVASFISLLASSKAGTSVMIETDGDTLGTGDGGGEDGGDARLT